MEEYPEVNPTITYEGTARDGKDVCFRVVVGGEEVPLRSPFNTGELAVDDLEWRFDNLAGILTSALKDAIYEHYLESNVWDEE